MDKTTLGLLAAAGALAVTPALAATSADVTESILKPRTVAELLEPVPQPIETLAKLDAARQLEPVEVAQADVQVAQLGLLLGHHHHHHHHRHYIYHHHHHHHRFYRHHHHHFNNY
jgi:hypothetical protein